MQCSCCNNAVEGTFLENHMPCTKQHNYNIHYTYLGCSVNGQTKSYANRERSFSYSTGDPFSQHPTHCREFNARHLGRNSTTGDRIRIGLALLIGFIMVCISSGSIAPFLKKYQKIMPEHVSNKALHLNNLIIRSYLWSTNVARFTEPDLLTRKCGRS